MIGPLAYIGGKRRLAKTIIGLLPSHTTYVEPFAGGAQVFFHKTPSRVEVLNDLDGEIINFLRVSQQHCQELARWLKWNAASRRLFEIFSRQDPSTLTDVQRAARFLYLQKNCFGGRRHCQSFHYAVSKTSNYSPERLPTLLTRTADRLQNVQLECLPYQEVLKRYDRPATFFYCDPPYIGLNLYRHNFTDDNFAELADRLAGLKGRFLLSINDSPKAHQWFGKFHCREVELIYTAVRVPRPCTELLFSNYPLPAPSAP